MKDNRTHLLYATAIGLILSDIVPTPADALYFKWQSEWKSQLQKGEITPEQYWKKDVVAYYGLNPIWWTLVLGASVTLGKTFEQKLLIFAGVLSGGAVVGVINKNIQKDIQNG